VNDHPDEQSQARECKPALTYWGDLCPMLLKFLQEQPQGQATTSEAYRALRFAADFTFPRSGSPLSKQVGGSPTSKTACGSRASISANTDSFTAEGDEEHGRSPPRVELCARKTARHRARA